MPDSLETDAPISRWQSSTVRNSLVGFISSLLVLITALTGKVFDITAITNMIYQGWPIIGLVITTWTSWRAYTGRVNATQVIKK